MRGSKQGSCFKRSMNLSLYLFCTCWRTLGTSLRFDPQHTPLTIPDSPLSFSLRVQMYVTDVYRWTSNVTHVNSHDLPDNSLGALTYTQIPEKERRKKKRIKCSLRTGPRGTPNWWHSSSIFHPSPQLVSPNIQCLCFLTVFVWWNTISSPSFSNLQRSGLIPLGGMNSGSSMQFLIGSRNLRRQAFRPGWEWSEEGWVSSDSIFRYVILKVVLWTVFKEWNTSVYFEHVCKSAKRQKINITQGKLKALFKKAI